MEHVIRLVPALAKPVMQYRVIAAIVFMEHPILVEMPIVTLQLRAVILIAATIQPALQERCNV
jgi:hypothetical protein